MTTHLWLRGPLLGAAVGIPVLGVGGRVVMRAIAVLTNAPSGLTLSGTFTVIAAGAASGIGGGLIYALLARLFPRHRVLRATLFATALALLTARGLNPVRPLPLALFLPLVVIYGVGFELAWHRAETRVPSALPS